MQMNSALPSGKLPGKVLQEEILQKVRMASRPELIVGPGLGLDCAVLKCGSGYCVASMDPITGATAQAGTLAIQVTANDVAACGVEPMAIFMTILVPPGTTTNQISEIAQQAATEAQRLNLAIAGGHTEVTSAVTRPVVVTTGIGYTEEIMPGSAAVRPGDCLCMTKAIAMEGTAILAADFAPKLRELGISEAVIKSGQALGEHLSVVREGILARKFGAIAMHDATEGGLWGAVEEMCAAGGCGVRVWQERVPLRLESSVICEALGVDPYSLLSSGSMLVVVRQDVEGFLGQMREAEIETTHIGEFLQGESRVIIKNGEEFPLTGPPRDEIYRILEILANEEAVENA